MRHLLARTRMVWETCSERLRAVAVGSKWQAASPSRKPRVARRRRPRAVHRVQHAARSKQQAASYEDRVADG